MRLAGRPGGKPRGDGAAPGPGVSPAPRQHPPSPGNPNLIGRLMIDSKQKVLQYLGEAQATEDALLRVLQSQIAMTPRGTYRTALEQHLRETREHSARVGDRRRELGEGGNPLTVAVGAVERLVGQALALGKTP